ncbi:hypothetical protein [Acrocarpospora catenulata]|uniref:hypothetical protein n=1 Tax=Acrocarpospora catenulata TaxID=2836182 RepID=UPI001BD9D4EA|nr:hypothetical protein [Acrocarpospora catenulata]
MGRSVKGNSALARPYRDLVWLAYLTLPPNGGEWWLLPSRGEWRQPPEGGERRPTEWQQPPRGREPRPTNGTEWRQPPSGGERWPTSGTEWRLPSSGGESRPTAGGGEWRLALAHRLAARALHRHPGDLSAARQEVLVRALRQRPRAWPGLPRRLEVVPAIVRSDGHEFTAALESLPPAARAAYALTRLEGLPSEEARRVLGAAGVPEPSVALGLVDALEDEFAPGDHRPAADPTLARVYGRHTPRRRAALFAAFLALLVAAVPYWLTLDDATGNPAPALTLHRVAAGTWQTTTTLDLRAWEPRGTLKDDPQVTGRALRAWLGAVHPETLYGVSPGPPTADPQLLYAGGVDGGIVVLMRDPGRIARYAESQGVSSLELFPEPHQKADAASPLKLSGSRYLLPPWVAEVSSAVLSRLGARWATIAVTDGVTAPIPPVQTGPCWRGPIIRLRAPKVAPGLPYTMIDFGRLSLAAISHQPPPPAPALTSGPHPLDSDTSAFIAWAYLGCSLPFPATEVQSATAWEFWSGALPENATGRWFCTRFTNADGTSTTRAILLATAARETTALPTGQSTNTWNCSRLNHDLVSGTWWRAPSGRWHYLAAASRRITRLGIAAPYITDTITTTTFTTTPGPISTTVPRIKVTLKALTPEGTTPTILQPTSDDTDAEKTSS